MIFFTTFKPIKIEHIKMSLLHAPFEFAFSVPFEQKIDENKSDKFKDHLTIDTTRKLNYEISSDSSGSSRDSEQGTPIFSTNLKNLERFEPILQEPRTMGEKYALRTDKGYQHLWKLVKDAQQTYWIVEEVDLEQDERDWNEKLTKEDRHFIEHILAYFATADRFVNENLVKRFMNDVKISEAQSFYAFQISQEEIHSEMYALMLMAYVKDKNRLEELFNAVDDVDVIRKKALWAKKWIENEDAPFASRLLAFICIEGIFFSGAFCAIFWLKNRSIMKGLSLSNDFIRRDEGGHCTFGIGLYKLLKFTRLEESVVHSIVKEAVDIEKEFICVALSVKLIGMNADSMSQYIEFVTNRHLRDLGYNELYPGVKNPFPFMDTISLPDRSDFFARRQSNYVKAKAKSPSTLNFMQTPPDGVFMSTTTSEKQNGTVEIKKPKWNKNLDF